MGDKLVSNIVWTTNAGGYGSLLSQGRRERIRHRLRRDHNWLVRFYPGGHPERLSCPPEGNDDKSAKRPADNSDERLYFALRVSSLQRAATGCCGSTWSWSVRLVG